ncbi:AAA family ATPase [Streptomyces sp. WMMC500]|uniref:helix-turn-helix transcriptional regulator n=1 Tax=Streptomyces sp. WMMC500 TaxID=3015154 RepID=UPI00248D37C3|nr:AAA family ATPase [Streptomyces sp. WMMC500]WBB61304.1 AAA family ATPase [Streptomyces sp. WMMC500]
MRGTPRLDTVPLVERDYQTGLLDVALDSCRNGAGGVVVVEGGFGTGKTALLRAAQDRAAAAGFTVLRARSSEFESTFPYGIVRQLFEPYFAAAPADARAAAVDGPAVLASPLFDHRHPVAHGDISPRQHESILRGLHWMLVNMSRRSSVLLVLDDLHWADAASLRFLQYIESRLRRDRVLCVAATASVDCGAYPDITDALRGSPAVRSVPVDVLSEKAVGEILGAVLDVAPDPESAYTARLVTGGNPGLLHELVSELRRAPGPGVPWGPGLVARASPRMVARAVQRWVGHVPQDDREGARRLTDALAVVGGSAGYAELADVTGLTPREVREAVGVLTDIGVVEPGVPPRLAHPIVRNAVYEHMPRAGRYRAHAAAAQALARSGAPPEKVAEHLLHIPPVRNDRLATARPAVGDTAELPPARRAFAALLDGASGADVGRLAEEAWQRGPRGPEAKGDALAPGLIALCLSCCGRLSEAAALLDDSVRRVEALGLVPASRDLRSLRAYVQLSRGLLAEADTDATAALSDAAPDNATVLGRPFAVYALTEVLLLRNQIGAAAAAFARHGTPGDAAHATHPALSLPLTAARGRLRLAEGDTVAGALDLLHVHELLTEHGVRSPAFDHAVRAVPALTALGRADEARALAAERLLAARAFGDPRTLACALTARATTVSGDSSLAMLTEAAEHIDGTGAVVDRCEILVRLGAGLREAGRTAQARRTLGEAIEVADSAGLTAPGKQARRELSAMGVRVRRVVRTGVAGLTPREHRVSLLAVEGKSNRQIARILFVTVKTVEWHLSQVYRKLGIASRRELGAALAGD